MRVFLKPAVLAAAAAVLLSSCHTAINKSVYVEDGEKISHGCNVINGNITVGDNCMVKGDCRSVNGSIRIGSKTETSGLQTVNGGITVGSESVIHGSIGSVNGPVECGRGVRVRRDVSTVNGDIDLTRTEVEYDLFTYNGDITLQQQSRVHGDLIIKESKGSGERKNLTIRLKEGSVVKGDVENRARNTKVRLIISGGSRVEGRTRGVDVIEG